MGLEVFSLLSSLTRRYLRVQNQMAKAITNPNSSTDQPLELLHDTNPLHTSLSIHGIPAAWQQHGRQQDDSRGRFGNSFLYNPFNPGFWAGSVYVSLVNLHTWEVLTFHIAQRVQQSFGICRIYFQKLPFIINKKAFPA